MDKVQVYFQNADLESPVPASAGTQGGQEMSSPSKESAKARAQRPGSRLQELEHELAKIHQKSPNIVGSIATATAPVTMVYSTPIQASYQQSQTVLSTVLPMSNVPVAAVAPSVVTPLANVDASLQNENQDSSAGTAEVSSQVCKVTLSKSRSSLKGTKLACIDPFFGTVNSKLMSNP